MASPCAYSCGLQNIAKSSLRLHTRVDSENCIAGACATAPWAVPPSPRLIPAAACLQSRRMTSTGQASFSRPTGSVPQALRVQHRLRQPACLVSTGGLGPLRVQVPLHSTGALAGVKLPPPRLCSRGVGAA